MPSTGSMENYTWQQPLFYTNSMLTSQWCHDKWRVFLGPICYGSESRKCTLDHFVSITQSCVNEANTTPGVFLMRKHHGIVNSFKNVHFAWYVSFKLAHIDVTLVPMPYYFTQYLQSLKQSSYFDSWVVLAWFASVLSPAFAPLLLFLCSSLSIRPMPL